MLQKLINLIVSFVTEVGATLLFSLDALRVLLRKGIEPGQVVTQMYAVGVRSLSTTVVTGAFVGAIMAIQINMQLRDFGAQGFLGGLATSITIRNVGPVLIGFILSGKVGAYTSAELGTMQVTDQINAIRLLGADPIQYLILPRMVAVVLSSFLLLIVGLMMTIGGGVLVAGTFGVNPINYAHNIPNLVSWWSVLTGIFKSFVFGLIIAVISCYKGYTTRGGSVGVGNTVKNAAMQTLVCIIVADQAISIVTAVLLDFFGVGRA